MAFSYASLLIWKSLVSNSELLCKANNAPINTTVTSLQFIIASHKTPILTGYSDGTVRLWNTIQQTTPLTSFRAFNNPSPLHLGWHQNSERIVAASSEQQTLVQLWDLQTERKILNLQTGSDLPLTCITCTPDSMFAASFRDGHTRIFDWRLPHDPNCVTIAMPHPSAAAPILSTTIRSEDSTLACCLHGGSFFRFDLRFPGKFLANWHADRGSSLATIHPTAPLVAFGGDSGVCVYNLDGEEQSMFRTVQATAMAFHREQIQLAVGDSDGTVSFYSDRKNTM